MSVGLIKGGLLVYEETKALKVDGYVEDEESYRCEQVYFHRHNSPMRGFAYAINEVYNQPIISGLASNHAPALLRACTASPANDIVLQASRA